MRRYWSADDQERLRLLYPSLPTAEAAKVLRRTVSAVYGMAEKVDLAKSQEFLDSDESGRLRKGQSRPGSEATRFKTGQIPFNKGLRRPGWHAGRMKETQFKPGCRSKKATAFPMPSTKHHSFPRTKTASKTTTVCRTRNMRPSPSRKRRTRR